MSEREGAQDLDELRRGLHALVEDVEPRGDALARVLAARRRRSRRVPRRPLLAAGGLAVAAAAVVAVVLPGQQERAPEPVGIAPNSYVAVSPQGAVAAFDVVSGAQVRHLGDLGGPVRGAPVADGRQVYARVAAGSGEDVVRVAPDGSRSVVRHLAAPSPVLAVGGGRVAFLDGTRLVVAGAGETAIEVPAGQRVLDVALAGDGRLAVLTSAGPGRGEIRVLAPGATALDAAPLGAAGVCRPLALAWTGGDVAALSAGCTAGDERVRVSTLDPAGGEPLGAGAPFDAGAVPDPERVQLSVDRVGRFLVSAAGSGQWVVDGSDVRPIPAACAPAGCAAEPATFWG